MRRLSGPALTLFGLWLGYAPALCAEPTPEPVPTAAAVTPLAPPGAFEPEPESSWLVPIAHAGGLMLTMRVGAAIIWPDPFADLSWQRISSSYRDAYTLPPKWDGSRSAFEWDGDPWPVNVVGHGLFGSELFLRARVCRKSVPEALLFTTLGSAAWEYAVEATAVRPSALDLWYTPLAGMLLGELRYFGWRAARRTGDRTLRRTLMVVFDPLGEIERAAGTRC